MAVVRFLAGIIISLIVSVQSQYCFADYCDDIQEQIDKKVDDAANGACWRYAVDCHNRPSGVKCKAAQAQCLALGNEIKILQYIYDIDCFVGPLSQ